MEMLAWRLALLGVALATPSCEMELEGQICLNGGQEVLLPPSVPDGLVGHWSFDHAKPFDLSGNGQDGAGEVLAGPPHNARGSSAHFDQSFVLVPNTEQLSQPVFSYTFFVFLGHHPKEATSLEWCPLLRKGSPQGPEGEEHAPSVLVNREGKVKVVVTTDQNPGEMVISNGHIRRNQWVGIAVVRSPTGIQLYLDGLLDNQFATTGQSTVTNALPLYIGGDPWTQEKCFIKLYIDEVKMYNRALVAEEVSSGVGSSAGSEFVALGCVHCTSQAAATSCPPTHHLCSSLELHTGATQAADQRGWVAPGGVWTNAEVAKGGPGEKVALCCAAL